jgi:hypothetical protein
MARVVRDESKQLLTAFLTPVMNPVPRIPQQAAACPFAESAEITSKNGRNGGFRFTSCRSFAK